MPNWCEGWIKFRGHRDNIIELIKSEFGGKNAFDCGDFIYPNIPTEKAIRIKSLVRAIVEKDDLELANYDIWTKREYALLAVKIQHAWNVKRQGYAELAKKYDVDIKGKCYEKGMLFTEEFEYNSNGEEVFYKVCEYDDYIWECECPTLGG